MNVNGQYNAITNIDYSWSSMTNLNNNIKQMVVKPVDIERMTRHIFSDKWKL